MSFLNHQFARGPPRHTLTPLDPSRSSPGPCDPRGSLDPISPLRISPWPSLKCYQPFFYCRMVLNTRSIQNNCQSIPLPCLWAIYGHFIYFLVTKKSVMIAWRKVLTFKHKIHHSVCIGHGQCQQVYIGVNAIFRISCSVNMLSCQSGRDIGLTDVCNQQWTNITVLLTFGRGVNAKIGFFWLVSNLSVPSMNIPKFIGVEKTGCKHFKQTALALLTWYLTKQPLIYPFFCLARPVARFWPWKKFLKSSNPDPWH